MRMPTLRRWVLATVLTTAAIAAGWAIPGWVGRGIGSVAAQTTAHRQTLGQRDLDAEAASRFLLQQPRRPHREIDVFRHLGQRSAADDCAIFA